jgi:excisionase family DNA binding protein
MPELYQAARTSIACSVRDAAARIGISRSSFYLAIARGEIPIVKVGSRTLVLDDDLRAYLARQRVVVAPCPSRTTRRDPGFMPTVLEMSRKGFWAIALVLSAPLTWVLREIWGTIIGEGLTKRLEDAFGLKEAEAVSLAIPFVVVIAIIWVIYRIAYHQVRTSQKDLVIPATPRLCCSFAQDIPGCMQNTVRHFSRALPEFQPPFTTVQPSHGAFSLVEDILLYRIKVEALVDSAIKGCCGNLLSISTADGSFPINVTLPFAPAERADAISKTVHGGVPEYLDVFYITAGSQVRIKSHMNLPSSINEQSIFSRNGTYLFVIKITSPDAETESIELLLSWEGEARTAIVSRV